MEFDAANIAIVSGIVLLAARSFGLRPIEFAKRIVSRATPVVTDGEGLPDALGIADTIPPNGFADHVFAVLAVCESAPESVQIGYLRQGLTVIETLQAENERLNATKQAKGSK